jgi:hypothetical protein
MGPLQRGLSDISPGIATRPVLMAFLKIPPDIPDISDIRFILRRKKEKEKACPLPPGVEKE